MGSNLDLAKFDILWRKNFYCNQKVIQDAEILHLFQRNFLQEKENKLFVMVSHFSYFSRELKEHLRH